MKLVSLVAVLVVIMVSDACAEIAESWTDRLDLSGWIETIQSRGVYAPHESITSRARMRLNLDADFEYVYASISADAEKNWKIGSKSGVDLHEFWLEHAESGWDLRLGRQTIIWGKADGVQITDVICPPDYTESITRDLDEIRMPVDAAKFRLLSSDMDMELIWIPVFEAAELPKGDNPWATKITWPAGTSVVTHAADEPDLAFENSEVALKVSTYRSGFDVSASAFYTWDDFAANHRVVTMSGGTPSITFSPKHHRMTVLGLDFSRPWSDFVFRCEIAGYLGRYFDTKLLDIQPKRKNSVKWLAGVDWTPGDDWSVIFQLFEEEILDYESVLSANQHDFTATLNISKKLLRQTLTLSCMVYFNVNDQDSFVRTKADYEMADGVHFLLGTDMFNGRQSGSYGQYHDNSQVWVKAKYSF
ncbi:MULTISPECIES: DUF1302 family protein [unclassified Pseudodesulfovibrio]|uniref:DUF1302 family protein n=1 Tax=unclassified Pseudodesulfovibrio TaxID=2661612 RepID=UPI0013E2FA77|nr:MULTISPECIES: DUF1302 family protein [unclassified Pseudodesulfovibrio]MCJ2163391.1 hypothetical protein [Pseudodesulfovibrio sp. S3-i]